MFTAKLYDIRKVKDSVVDCVYYFLERTFCSKLCVLHQGAQLLR